jgi:septum formation topological specificity factor MinE
MNRQQLKERLKTLTPEEREKLKEYTDALSEIKKEIKELLNKGKRMEEVGGNKSTNQILYINQEE